LHTRTLNTFKELVYSKSGIKLDDSKELILRAYVGKRMRALGMTDYDEYLRHVIQDESDQEIVHLLDATSTNVTSFFRESDHFQFLGDSVKEWLSLGKKRIRIWSAACSSGEEPYSIAMTVLEAGGNVPDIKILATDISTRALEKARLGLYEAEKMGQIPEKLIKSYFERVSKSDTDFYKVKPGLRNMVVFRRLNLLVTPFPIQRPIDIIFCRNVMIYFDGSTRQRLLEEMYRLLKPYGYLVVGHAESLVDFMGGFKALRPSIYVKDIS